ncbi:MAG TPA: VOC family protein [Thermohalobaculum sp.]|nr:VOC family protein [Thermohalobaculum sp.]
MTGQPGQAVLDHIVINARSGLDRAEAVFRALGFALTPRGYHSLGSMNHLAMFDADYLELIGVPEGREADRPEVGLAPLGLNGLVFRSRDVAATHQHLAAIGAAAEPPKAFSRPVALEDGTARDARFRTVTAAPSAFPAGRLYFCEHLTPELLWRPEWLGHPNGVTGFAELVVVAPDPAGLALRLAEIIGAAAPTGDRIGLPAGCLISFLTPADYIARFGGLARDIGTRPAMLGALGFRCADPARMAGFLDAAGVAPDRRATGAGGISAALDDLDLLLEFRAG